VVRVFTGKKTAIEEDRRETEIFQDISCGNPNFDFSKSMICF